MSRTSPGRAATILVVGVGPMTVTMLLANTITAAQRMWGQPSEAAISPA
jgi:5,10-methylene-tetrahydrofolate dehydrogenase/methenyl tetrahydrofolate cyclohydrolase